MFLLKILLKSLFNIPNTQKLYHYSRNFAINDNPHKKMTRRARFQKYFQTPRNDTISSHSNIPNLSHYVSSHSIRIPFPLSKQIKRAVLAENHTRNPIANRKHILRQLYTPSSSWRHRVTHTPQRAPAYCTSLSLPDRAAAISASERIRELFDPLVKSRDCSDATARAFRNRTSGCALLSRVSLQTNLYNLAARARKRWTWRKRSNTKFICICRVDRVGEK